MTVSHELEEKRAPAREHPILGVQLEQQRWLTTNGGATTRSNHERLACRTEQCRDGAAGLHCLLGLPLLLSEAAGRTTRARRGRLVIPERIRRDLFI
jgi:arylamine N-acetyltransferase